MCVYFFQYIDSINQQDKSIKLQSFRKLDVETSENVKMLFSISMNCSLETHFSRDEVGHKTKKVNVTVKPRFSEWEKRLNWKKIK